MLVKIPYIALRLLKVQELRCFQSFPPLIFHPKLVAEGLYLGSNLYLQRVYDRAFRVDNYPEFGREHHAIGFELLSLHVAVSHKNAPHRAFLCSHLVDNNRLILYHLETLLPHLPIHELRKGIDKGVHFAFECRNLGI